MPNPATPFTGYVPRFEMPIVPPPPANYPGAPVDYYQQLQIELALAASGPNGEFLDVTMTRAPNSTNTAPIDATFFAVTGGFVRYYPSGSTVPSPDNFLAPANGVIALTVWLGDVLAQQRAFPVDTPATGRIYYVGSDQSETSAFLRTETAKMSDAALRASWKDQQGSAPPAGTTSDDLIDQHHTRVMIGLGAVFVDAGTPIGKAVRDTAVTAETYKFTIRLTDNSAPMNYVSALPLFRGAPYYDL